MTSSVFMFNKGIMSTTCKSYPDPSTSHVFWGSIQSVHKIYFVLSTHFIMDYSIDSILKISCIYLSL